MVTRLQGGSSRAIQVDGAVGAIPESELLAGDGKGAVGAVSNEDVRGARPNIDFTVDELVREDLKSDGLALQNDMDGGTWHGLGLMRKKEERRGVGLARWVLVRWSERCLSRVV